MFVTVKEWGMCCGMWHQILSSPTLSTGYAAVSCHKIAVGSCWGLATNRSRDGGVFQKAWCKSTESFSVVADQLIVG